MTTFPGAPRLLKGAIVSFDLFNPVPTVIAFQINPNTLTRTLEPQVLEGEGSEAFRFTGAPTETIKLDVEIDATDQLEKAEGTAVAHGIFPQLAALEMLLYPRSAQVILNTVLMNVGTLEILPSSAPLTLFIWGAKRILPVRLTEYSAVEDTHSPSLNPIRAKVSLGLRVLSYSDLTFDNPGWALFMSHQIVKETMAVIGSVNNLDAVLGGNASIF
jgi:hypothetical protein